MGFPADSSRASYERFCATDSPKGTRGRINCEKCKHRMFRAAGGSCDSFLYVPLDPDDSDVPEGQKVYSAFSLSASVDLKEGTVTRHIGVDMANNKSDYSVSYSWSADANGNIVVNENPGVLPEDGEE